jgi:hypothetical protein
MTNIRTYDGWCDTSLTDRKNERALLSAFVAVIVVWAAAFLLAVIWACGQSQEPLAERSTALSASNFQFADMLAVNYQTVNADFRLKIRRAGFWWRDGTATISWRAS